MKMFQRPSIILLLLGVVFAAPGLSAYFFYTHAHWLQGASTNKGVLFNPPVKLDALEHAAEPKPSKGVVTGPQWHLLLMSPTSCEQACMEQLDKLMRIRLALGRRLYRVVPHLILDAHAAPLSHALANSLREQGISVLRLSSNVDGQAPVLQHRLHLFIANPDHYLVLSYAPTVAPNDIFHDLNHLLKNE